MPIIVIREHENDVNNDSDFLPFFFFLVTDFHAL